MERTHKSWGEKWNLFQNDLNEVSILYLKPNQRCSWHRHAAKYNQFFVIEGTLYIKTEAGVAEVGKNQIFTTRPGEMHEFQTKESPATIQEIMYVQYDAEDIQREKVGGPLNKEDPVMSEVIGYTCINCNKPFWVPIISEKAEDGIQVYCPDCIAQGKHITAGS